MSGEIKYFKDSEGVSRQVDYQYLANKPFAAPTSSDEGKALVVDSTGDPVWASVLPVGGCEGDVLIIDNNELTWGHVMPSHTSSDAGKALVVNENGNGTLWGRIIPTYDHSIDDGKVLTVDGTEIVWSRAIPSAVGINGTKVLTAVVSGQSEIVGWSTPTSIGAVPSHTSGDAGKALMVGEQGDLEWGSELPSGGSVGQVLAIANSYDDLEWISVLPSFDSYADAGKVLTVTDTSLVWSAGVPSLGDADVGDVLAVSTSNEFGWEPIVRVPAYTSSDAGKTLKVNANGDGLEWA